MQGIWFILAGIFAILLILGFKTRFVTLISWYLAYSLQIRNPLVLTGGDTVLRLALFWGIFLPLGQKWSLDNLHSPTQPIEKSTLSIGTVGYLTQILCIYWTTSLLKTGSAWKEGTAVYFSLATQTFSTHWGQKMLEFPDLLKGLSFFTLYLEQWGPFFWLIPLSGLFPIARSLSLFLFITLHFGFILTLKIGIFPWINLVTLVALLPTAFWDWAETLFSKRAFSNFIPFKNQLHSLGPTEMNLKRDQQPSVWVQFGIFLQKTFAVSCLVWIIAWNIKTYDKDIDLLPYPVKQIGATLGLNQKWSMFSPNPPRLIYYFSIPGILSDGKMINLWDETIFSSLERPEMLADEFQNYRWRKMLTKLRRTNYRWLRFLLGDYLCRKWNRFPGTNEPRLSSFNILVVEQKMLEVEVITEDQTRILAKYSCKPIT